MQEDMVAPEMSPPPAPFSPPTSPSPRYSHRQRPSTASLAMSHMKRSSSRINDAMTSRSGDEELRTAVKVAVRVRPPMRPSDPGYDLIPQRFRESTCDVPTPSSLSIQSQQGKKLFVFDRVFGEDTTQDGVWEYLSDSVSSFVKGYNVSVLAYGQSGSGKSYTMGTSGPEDQSDPQIMGVVPRAAQALFEKLNGAPQRQSALVTPKRYSTQVTSSMSALTKAVNSGADKGWTLKATYLEIYQEHLRDLLVPESVPQQDRAAVAIREDLRGRILVTGLTQVTINSVEDLLNALNFGSTIRQTDATAVNARSSRSHAVFSLNLIQKKSEAPMRPKHERRMSTPIESMSGTEDVVTLDSKLHFVDLAGSERLKNTGATGDRAKEGISINAGLASLGKVISQLSTKHPNAHISYRDSKLTRLLQDSLGGNAITFMVACVTPAVFHLSETLNTVHYAQRARAIQSKPEIQQNRDDGDKQGTIDRLRAEVSFLRDQIRHSENADGNSVDNRGRADKLRSKEAELQTQLMDMQENYNALSSRQAKLIQELSKARDGESTDTPLLNEAIGVNATERVKRSSSFAQAVEQMVLEYEKTIRSLESSLSNTRGSLSNSESTLLEKETRIAFMETTERQLRIRIDRAMEREQNNESYLHDLETRIEGSTSGEEKNNLLIMELRKEIARARESETSAEDYISTLEDRLAETEQDQEIMQREIDRLEHVVERQRSIGRLDNLLGELDTIQHGEADHVEPEAAASGKPVTNGHRESYDPFRSVSRSVSSASSYPERGMTERSSEYAPSELTGNEHETYTEPDQHATRNVVREAENVEPSYSATQDDFMADKVESLTSELFDLRSEHDSVLSDHDKLQQKYMTALETLARLEYDKETSKLNGLPSAEAKPFLVDAGMREEDKAVTDEQPSSSRSLSEDLSLPQQSITSLDDLARKVNTNEMPVVRDRVVESDDLEPSQVSLPNEEEESELSLLRRVNKENETGIAKLTRNYKSLQAQHKAALVQVEDLKQEVTKAQSFRPSSPSFNKTVFRRSNDLMSSHNDRASRSVASLRNIAQDSFEQNPDQRQSFQLSLDALTNELNSRSERAQSLEAELMNTRKEMDAKQTIIAGLTRERSSLKASLGVDFSVVSQMREQLLEGESQIRALQDQHAAREAEFQEQIESLKASLSASQAVQSPSRSLPTPTEEDAMAIPGGMPGGYEETPIQELGEQQALAGADQLSNEQSGLVSKLQDELAAWETRHNDTVGSLQASEAKLLATIAEMEGSMRHAELSRSISNENSEPTVTVVASPAGLLEERQKHTEVVEALERQVEHHKATANGHAARLEQLEQDYSSIVAQVDEDSRSRAVNAKELETHKDLVANLENQLQVHKSAITIHQESLESLQASHTKEMEDLKASSSSTLQRSEDRYNALESEHKAIFDDLQTMLTSAQEEKAEMLRNASSALGYSTNTSSLHTHIKGLVDEGKELHTRHLKTTNELKTVQEELQNAKNHASELEAKVAELKELNEDTVRSLERSNEREKKSAKLVDELEEQLNSNFDSHKATNYRLSTIQGEVAQQRVELEHELESQKMLNQALEVGGLPAAQNPTQETNSRQQQLQALNRHSAVSNISVNRDSLLPEGHTNTLARNESAASTRKINGSAALPTPPPSIPLPPLPNGSLAPTADTQPQPSPLQRTTSPQPNNTNNNVSPPGSRDASHDMAATAATAATAANTQKIEEQESRIRTIEKHLFAEKQLTATLEEALVDLETNANRTKAEMDGWRKRCTTLENELGTLKKQHSRVSLQAVEEEREMRVRAEKARQALEERMVELNAVNKKKKKNALNCF